MLLFSLFAGHGMIHNNMQVLLCNELDPKTKFYKLFPVEELLRDLAAKYRNVYIVTLFACCRQKFDLELCCLFDQSEVQEHKDNLAQLAEYKLEAKKGELKFEEDLSNLTEEEQEIRKKAIEKSKNGTAPKARGAPYMPSSLMANLIMAWGCAPSKMVLADTRMIHDFFDTLRDRYNPKTLAVSFPSVLDDMLC